MTDLVSVILTRLQLDELTAQIHGRDGIGPLQYGNVLQRSAVDE
jgi:hypothetical protein